MVGPIISGLWLVSGLEQERVGTAVSNVRTHNIMYLYLCEGSFLVLNDVL